MRKGFKPIISKKELYHLCIIENKSDVKIGFLYGIKDYKVRHLRNIYKIFPTKEQLAIRNRMNNLGKKRSVEMCKKYSLSRMGPKNHNWGKPKSPETKAKLRESHLGEKNPSWKGGRYINNFGYIYILCPDHPYKNKDKYVLEHRLIIEKILNRYLKPKEVIHHINKNHEDNCLKNLMAFKNHGAHLRFERGCSISQDDIIFDGRNY